MSISMLKKLFGSEDVKELFEIEASGADIANGKVANGDKRLQDAIFGSELAMEVVHRMTPAIPLFSVTLFQYGIDKDGNTLPEGKVVPVIVTNLPSAPSVEAIDQLKNLILTAMDSWPSKENGRNPEASCITAAIFTSEIDAMFPAGADASTEPPPEHSGPTASEPGEAAPPPVSGSAPAPSEHTTTDGDQSPGSTLEELL